jgi:mono/diheme cytochrome c family protein
VKVISIVGLLLLLAIASANGWTQNDESAPKTGQHDSVTRGKYIVESVAVCGQCHTPHNSQHEPDGEHALQGAPLWLLPAKTTGDWPTEAPRLAGTPPGTDEQMITLLTTGIWRDGKRPRPPMPQFRMSRQDAEAAVAYLKSLNPPAQ